MSKRGIVTEIRLPLSDLQDTILEHLSARHEEAPSGVLKAIYDASPGGSVRDGTQSIIIRFESDL